MKTFIGSGIGGASTAVENAESQKGVGIGLYLTANILNAEGGRVSADSSPEGSVFSVYLPVS